MAELHGRCLCGAVTLDFEPADQLSACHCKSCQRWAGGVFLEIDVKPGTLRYEGPVKAFQSSSFAERAWCDQCGSTLWYHITVEGHDYHSVAAGLVDDAGGLQMKLEIYVDEKPGGFALAGDHARETKAEHEAKRAAFLQRVGAGEPG